MAYLYNGQPVNIRVEFFRADGVRYNNLLDAGIRTKIGIVENGDPDPFEPAAPDYDQRFYWGPNNPKLLNDREESDEKGNPLWVQTYDPATEAMVNTDKRLVTKGLKSQWTAQVKDTAGKMLAQTDWMVIRKAERNVEIPQATQTYRAAVVAECTRIETEIAGAADVPALIAVLNEQNWPKE